MCRMSIVVSAIAIDVILGDTLLKISGISGGIRVESLVQGDQRKGWETTL